MVTTPVCIPPLDSERGLFSGYLTPSKRPLPAEDDEAIVNTGVVAARHFDEDQSTLSSVRREIVFDSSDLDDDEPPAASSGSGRVFESPKRYYPVERDEDGRFSVLFTPGAKAYGRGEQVVYKIKRVGSREGDTDAAELAKVGMTAQGFIKRMQQHLSCANHPERDRGQSSLYNEMREEGSLFVMGVVTTIDDEVDIDDLGELEDEVIRDHNTLENGYNQRRGGGGGTIAKENEDPNFPDLPQENFRTPTKSGYRIKSRRRRVKGEVKSRLFVDISPNGKRKKNVVYGFRRDDGKWLIGETEQTFIERIYGYHYDINHPEKDTGQRPLPESIRDEPSRWRVYILYQGPAVKRMESLWIRAKNSIEDGFNQLGGGGGPSSAKGNQ